MKLYYFTILTVLCLLVSSSKILSQSATTTINYTGGLAAGGCAVCGGDYWCINNPPAPAGGYIGTSAVCDARTFFDPVPAGYVVTNVTVNYWTASCYGAALNGDINGFSVPVTFDGTGGCLCSGAPCGLTTSSTGNYPCGMPGYIYGGNNTLQICASTAMCINRAELVFTYVLPDVITPSITPSGPTSFCPGGSVILDAGAGYSAYSWSTGATSQSITASTTGTYSVSVTSTTGCTTGSSSATVTVYSNPTPTITGSTTYCSGSSTTLNAGAYSSYVWSTGASTQTINATSANNPITVTVTDGNGCSGGSASVNVSPLSLPTPVISGALNYCAGSGTTLDAGGPYSLYSWSNGGNSQTTSATIANNPVTVTVTDANGCTGTSPGVNLNENALPSPVITGSLTYCPSSSATLDAGSYSSYSWSTGATSQTINATTANNPINVTVTDVNGCTGISPTVNVSLASNLNPVITGATTYCTGSNATLDAGSYSSYVWSTGATTQTINATTADNPITVTVTDASGCTGSSSGVSVSEASLPAPSITGNSVYCAGSNSTLSTGIFSSYLWSNGGTTQTVNVTVADSPVSVTVTDANGCTGTSSNVDITENALPAPVINGSLSYCSGFSTTLNTGIFASYQWSTGAITQTINNVTTADNPISVTVTDGNGCSGISAVVNVSESANLNPVITGALAYCAGSNSLLDAGSFNTYNWSTGASTQTISATIASNPITVTVTDVNGCTGTSAPVNLTQNALPTPSFTGNTSYCAGSYTILDAGSYSSYIWSTGAITQTDTVTSADNPVSVTVTDANGCNGSTTSVDIVEQALPVPVIAGQLTYCNGSNSTLTTGSYSTYSWSNGATTPSITVTTADNPINVTVTDANGCTGISPTVTVSIAPDLTPSISGPLSYCAGSGTTLDAGSYASYSWSNGDTTQTILATTVDNPVTVTVTDVFGCTGTANVSVNENILPTPSITGTLIYCAGFNTTLSTGNFASYLWSNGDTTQNSNVTVANNPVSVIVTDTNGCTGTASASVTVSSIQISITSLTNVNCYLNSTGSISVSPAGGISPYTFLWSNGDTTNSISNLPSGNYTVTITDSNSCNNDTTIFISQPSLLNSNITVQNISCNGNTDGVLIANAQGGTSPYTYFWSNIQFTALISSLAEGNYSVTITDSNGCTSVSTDSIIEPSVISISDSTINPTCFGGNNGSVYITVTGGTPTFNYAWPGSINTQNLTDVGAGNYALTVTDANNCSQTSISALTNPPAMLISDTTLISANNTGIIDLTVTGGLLPYTYTWSNNAFTEDLSDLENGTYIVTITDFNLCSSTDTIIIDIPEMPITIPTVITPNGDHNNDDFEIKNIRFYSKVSVEIFNRWGDKLFVYDGTGTGYYATSNRWNGKHNGKDLPMGSYVFIVTIDDRKPVTGACSIIR